LIQSILAQALAQVIEWGVSLLVKFGLAEAKKIEQQDIDDKPEINPRV
jgi:hypothetical protein